MRKKKRRRVYINSSDGGQAQRRQEAEDEAQEEGQGRQAASAKVCATWTLGRRWRRLLNRDLIMYQDYRFTCLEIHEVLVS